MTMFGQDDDLSLMSEQDQNDYILQSDAQFYLLCEQLVQNDSDKLGLTREQMGDVYAGRTQIH